MTVTIYSAELLAKPLIVIAGFLLGFGVMTAITEFMKYIDHKMDLQTQESITKALETQLERSEQELDRARADCGRHIFNIERALKIARRNNQIDIVVILEEALK